MNFIPNRKFKWEYDRIYRRDPGAANLFLLLAELADERRQALVNHIRLLQNRYPTAERAEAVRALQTKLRKLSCSLVASALLWIAAWITRLPITKRLSLMVDRFLIMADRFKQ